ncbi:MAG: insulinase family protein [Calditrichaeota bacterium]|nr:MAG: insulinase family protein [bacterium]RQV98070.1 MAG: insulinase family protein [Calditrichota bacterium]
MKNIFEFHEGFPGEPREHQVTGFRLQNGLEVIFLKNSQVPIVAVDIWYKVGSKDEKPGKSGFAHLFEHMMFQGSENVGKAMHMKLINDIGGMVNGSTSQDRTNYWEVVPSNQLELALWLEADRMRSLKVTQENFENQRDTVKEERRLRIDNQPYMRAVFELKDEVAHQNFAYKHSVIGSMEDLDNATLEDVRQFHELYYRPNNAVLTLAGDFKAGNAYDLITRYFESIPAGDPVPQVDLSEPPHQTETRYSYEDPFAPFPALLVSYLIPERTHPDFPVLEILEKILFDGESCRFYQKLIEDQQLVLHMFGGSDGKFGPGLFFIFAQLHPLKEWTDLEKVVQQEFERVITGGVSEQELRKARNKVKADFISNQETVRSLADLMCLYTTLYQNPRRFFEEIPLYEQITLADIYRVAEKYFNSNNRSVIEVFPRKK